MFSAGETSGDIHCASVIEATNSLDSSINWVGMGSSACASAGAELLVDFSSIAVMGYVEVARNYRKLHARLQTLRNYLRDHKPELLVLVDYASFNLKLAETAKELDIPVLFYIGPKIWASRPGRIEKIRQVVSHMALILPFEERLFSKAGVPATYVGNPVVEQIDVPASRSEARNLLALPAVSEHKCVGNKSNHLIGLLPGSRQAELKFNLPVLLATAKKLVSQRPDDHCRFLIPLAPQLDESELNAGLSNARELDLIVVRDKSHLVMKSCDVLMVASGTATLEAAVIGTPMLSLYVMHWLNYHIMKKLVISDYVTLVNIQAEKAVIKEFIQQQATPEALSGELNKLLDDEGYRQTMISNLLSIRKELEAPLFESLEDRQGSEQASERVAALVLTMLQQDLSQHSPV